MPGLARYEDCTAIFYDLEGNNIGKALIIEHDRHDMSILVNDDLGDDKQGTRISVLIVHNDGVSEYNGIVRGMRRNAREISLFNRRQRGGREAVRYTVNMPAVIENLVEDSVRKPLSGPLHILVVNISTSGMLFKSKPGFFSMGSKLEVILNLGDKENLLFGEIIRETPNLDFTCDFGYKFIASAESENLI